MESKIGLGGSCHWCTEAIFQSVIGVMKVEQGWISSEKGNASFSEAVIVYFDDSIMSLNTLIEIHLHTHSCTSNHSMRNKYRSAVYYFDEDQNQEAIEIIQSFQPLFSDKIITQVLPFVAFKKNQDQFLDYYYSNPEKPFCQNIINPKLKILLHQFSSEVDKQKINAETFELGKDLNTKDTK